MGVGLGRLDVCVAEQLLHCADVGPAAQQLGGEAVAERVATRRLADTGLACGLLDRFPDAAAVYVVVHHIARIVLAAGSRYCLTDARLHSTLTIPNANDSHFCC